MAETEVLAWVRPARVEVELAAIRANVRLLDERSGEAEVCAVVKADGYGHGAVPVARACLEAGATWLAVALVEEGEQLRDAGIDAPILLLAEPPPEAVPRLVAAELTPTVYSAPMVEALATVGRQRGVPVRVHAKVDTGMGRVGVPMPSWPGFAADLAAEQGLAVEGLWTHLARADEPEVDTTDRQLARFDEAVGVARTADLRPRWLHAANSAATLTRSDAYHDLVRVGIAVYGLSPAPGMPAEDHDLRPALRLVTEVAFVKHVPAGTPVSYGHRWSSPAAGWLATLPVGYADGIPRALSNRVEVLIGGVRCPVVGLVCMDQILVWCGDTEVGPGEEAVLIGAQGDERISVDEWADAAETITYEIVTGLGPRLPRRHQE